MKLKNLSPRIGNPEFKLSPADERELRKRGHSGLIQNLKRATRGDSPTLREMERLLPSTAELNDVFRSVSLKLKPELFGSVVARFWDSVYYAVVLSENVHELACIKGRSRRADLKVLLEVILEGALAGQRRQVEGLRRDIPRLLKQLEPRNSHKEKRLRTNRESAEI
jgi:hypothetical protein